MAAAGGSWKGGAFIAARGPRVMTFEDYADMNNAPQFAWDVATQRLPNTSEGQRRRIVAREYRKQQANSRRREELRAEYDRRVASGEVRAPTRVETLMQRARGHEDLAATHASRRILAKMGIDWQGA